jgi:hypothetical protein
MSLLLASAGGGPGSPVIVDLALTDAQDTLAATGTVAISATLALTDATDTLTSAAAVRVTVNASITDQADALAAAAGAQVAVALALTDAADILASTVTVPAGAVIVDLALTDAQDTLSATCTVPQPVAQIGGGHFSMREYLRWAGPVRVRLDLRDDDDTLHSAATVGGWAPRVAELALTDGVDTLTATARIAWPPATLRRDTPALLRDPPLRLARTNELVREPA